MTLLRRAPREVYRVCGEEEFFAGTRRDESPEAAVPRAGERRLREVAGATILLAVVGAAGGLIAITSLSSVGSTARRVRSGLLAASGSLASSHAARAHVLPERASWDGSRPRGASDELANRARRARRTFARPLDRAILSHRSAASEVEASASVVRLTATASAAPGRERQSEFGFER
jgi:hypothetical protein